MFLQIEARRPTSEDTLRIHTIAQTLHALEKRRYRLYGQDVRIQRIVHTHVPLYVLAGAKNTKEVLGHKNGFVYPKSGNTWVVFSPHEKGEYASTSVGISFGFTSVQRVDGVLEVKPHESLSVANHSIIFGQGEGDMLPILAFMNDGSPGVEMERAAIDYFVAVTNDVQLISPVGEEIGGLVFVHPPLR